MLEYIKSTADLKGMKPEQLEQLTSEIRNKIIATVAQRGGHLSSNLGIVELTVALDYVFNDPNDRIIYDVGHQAYAHKLLTGRYEAFSTLRTAGGMSGFSSMAEHPGDAFTSGHASTSISAALGYSRARDLMGGSGAVVAVIGDGSLTGGMSYEAMNDAGQSGKGLIVVLNDNNMSISRNVGAIASHLTTIRQTHVYRRFKTHTRSLFARIPWIGPRLYRAVSKVRDMLKAMLIGDNLFDAMGFKYVGPVDGHNIKKLIKVFSLVKDTTEPVIVHVVTRKGKGYRPAEEEPGRFHGTGPFNPETGLSDHREDESYGAKGARIISEMANNRGDICAVCAAMPTGTGFSKFASEHPDRFFDVGIAEEHAVTMAAGLAASGLKPYVAIYSTFLQRAYDQIANDVCLNRLGVVFMIDRAGLSGADGVTHNGMLDLSYLRSIPNMAIAAPRDTWAFERLITFSADYNAPLAIRYPKDQSDMGLGFKRDVPVKLGMWETLLEGDVMIIAVGRMVANALQAAALLAGKGISAGVVDAMFIKPMDTELLNDIADHSALIVTVEENTLMGGFGEGVLDELSVAGKKCDVLTLGLPDGFINHASIAQQLRACGLDAEGIANAIQQRLSKHMEK